jgi:hypothetical protein
MRKKGVLAMAVLIEGYSVVIRLETIAEKYPGGVDQYIHDCPNGTLCMDEEIVRVGFMSAEDMNAFIRSLERLGFRCLTNGEFDEIAMVDQFVGISFPCDWLEYLQVVVFKGDMRVAICQIKGSTTDYFAIPAGWVYEDSLSKHSKFMDSENWDRRMIFLRYKDGFDVYLDTLISEEVYIQRTIRRNCNA